MWSHHLTHGFCLAAEHWGFRDVWGCEMRARGESGMGLCGQVGDEGMAAADLVLSGLMASPCRYLRVRVNCMGGCLVLLVRGVALVCKGRMKGGGTLNDWL